MKRWWAQYKVAPKRESWDDDIWHIWQREHGIGITREHANDVDDGKETSKKKMRAAVHGIKKLGQWAQKSRDAAESELRQYEERKRRLREEKKRVRREEARNKGKRQMRYRTILLLRYRFRDRSWEGLKCGEAALQMGRNTILSN